MVNDAIEGHLIRIKEYAEKYYNNAYFDIIPVQLKAAQLAQNETNGDIKKKLEKGSRLKYFKDDLQIQILENGKIRRSQTMLNGTIYSIWGFKNAFSTQIKELETIKQALKNQSDISLSKIEKLGKSTISNLEKGLNLIYDDFIQTDIRCFANEHYDQKRDLLDLEWKKYYEQSKFEPKVTNRIEREALSYKNEIENIIQEFSEKLTFSFKNLEILYDIENTFDTKTFMKVGGNLMALVGCVLALVLGASNPIGWVASRAGVAVSFIAMCFKSKKEKIMEAQDKLYESIKNAFNENRSINIRNIISNFKKTVEKTENGINNLFMALISELDKLIKDLKPLNKECAYYESTLNTLYGIRILNYAKKYKNKFNINDGQILSQIKVEHDFAKQIKIKTKLINHLDTEKLKRVLQEDIILEEI